MVVPKNYRLEHLSSFTEVVSPAPVYFIGDIKIIRVTELGKICGIHGELKN
jgi:hypothetical protein